MKNPYTEDQIITFVRIGQARDVPRLEVPAGRRESIQELIHDFVAQRLGTEQFTIQLTDGGGFIDMGTHSAGAFTLQPAAELLVAMGAPALERVND